jgi:hypothetical protein
MGAVKEIRLQGKYDFRLAAEFAVNRLGRD